MSFINPVWLLALPLVVLPIVIHLWNQRRHKSVRWGAMQFLLSAKRMSRGLARLRHWLIMAARMMAIAGIVLLVTRPLSTGWLGGIGGGRPETILILLDRSASMQQQRTLSGQSKLRIGTEKIVEAIETTGSKSSIFLLDAFAATSRGTTVNEIENPEIVSHVNPQSPGVGNLGGEEPVGLIPSRQFIPLSKPRDLLDLPTSAPTDASVDIPAILQSALDFVTTNQTGRTDIWILSDAAENDWHPESSRWEALVGGFSQLEGVRFHVFNFSEAASDNFTVRVERCERLVRDSQPELVLDLSVRRVLSPTNTPVELPVTIDVGGVRSVVNISLDGDQGNLLGHRIPLEQETKSGWGLVEIPDDSNPSDNRFYFTFAEQAPWHTVVVSEQTKLLRGMELAASVSNQRDATVTVTTVSPERTNEIDWDRTTLLIWQAEFPEGPMASQISSFIANGRTVVFLPPREPGETSFAGWTWADWEKVDGTGARVSFWNNADDLLKQTRGGQSLPLDTLLVYRYCRLNGGGRLLAKLENNLPLLMRSTEMEGAVYALTTLPDGTHSSLDRDGIAIYVLVQRALAQAAESQGPAKVFEAGSMAAFRVSKFPTLADSQSSTNELTTPAHMKPWLAGVYGDNREWIALNRPIAEERYSPVSNETLNQLFESLDFHLISEQLENERSLASEIWKLFVVLVIVMLLIEAALSLPEDVRRRPTSGSTANVERAAA